LQTVEQTVELFSLSRRPLSKRARPSARSHLSRSSKLTWLSLFTDLIGAA
jgi:hypothetical protein